MNDMTPIGGGFGVGDQATVVRVDDDGGVTITSPAVRKQRDNPADFHKNLADRVDNAIVYELLDRYEHDQSSRAGFIENYTSGIDLLGLETKDDKSKKTSQIGHPLLLESVVRAQSAAGAELLPSSGPCKVQLLGGDAAASDELAQAFQSDMNAYLTAGAPEYYPDTDRMLFGFFYSGNAFKKVYQHPLRKRPVSESVGVEDLIVSEDATDLETAIQYAHRSFMSRSQVRRMMTFGDWVDEDLSPGQPTTDQIKQAQDRTVGMSGAASRPQDVPHEILEITADLDLGDYGFDQPALPDLPLSYIVTIDKVSRKMLAVRRGWKDGDEQFKRRQRFVHYGMVPSFGFLCLGFLHLLGNQTKALRGIWRLLVTSGMYANAPGGFRAKGVRLNTNDINPGPGEWPELDIGSFDDIGKALMPMPYKDVSAVFMQLAESIGQDAMRMGGMATTEVGEGRTNTPVGTIMSMIEVATQTMSAVHKRMHRAQARELELIKELFAENPEALGKLPGAARQWAAAEEFANLNLLPASDPNVPSQIHRIQLATAMVTVAGTNPDIYDRPVVHKRAWKSIGVTDPESFVLDQPMPQAAPGGAAPPDPLIGQAKMLEAQAKMQAAQQGATDQQRKAAEAAIQDQQHQREQAGDLQSQQMELEMKQQTAQAERDVEQTRLQIERERLGAEHERETHATHLDAATKVYNANMGFAGTVHAAKAAAKKAASTGAKKK